METGKSLDHYIFCLALFCITLFVFAGVADNEFLLSWDDAKYVTDNHFVNTGISLRNLYLSFTTFVSGNWHPVTMLSHMTDVQLFGLDPRYHHISNLLIHCVNTVLVYIFFITTTGNKPCSFFTALIFGIHPLHVESIAWVSERKDLLSSFFILAALCIYPRCSGPGEMGPRRGLFAVVILLHLLGLMSKAMVVTFPFILLLVDFWPLKRFETQKPSMLVAEKIPLFCASAIFSAITLFSQEPSHSYNTANKIADLVKVTLYNVSYAIEMYLIKFIYPYKMSHLYDYIYDFSDTAFMLQMFFLFLAIAVLLFAYRARHRHTILFFGLSWFMIGLLPVLGIIKIGLHSHADRYMYLPVIGLITVACHGVCAFGRKGVYVLLLACIFWSYSTYRYEKTWNTMLSMYHNTLSNYPDNYHTHLNIGGYYFSQKNYSLALYHYERALSLVNYYNKNGAYLGLGLVYNALNETGLAIDNLEEFARTTRTGANINVYGFYLLADLYSREKRYDMALSALDRGLMHFPLSRILQDAKTRLQTLYPERSAVPHPVR